MLLGSPSRAFAFGVQTLHSSRLKPQGRLTRPVHRPSDAYAHSGGTLPLISRRASASAERKCLCGDWQVWQAMAPASCASRSRAAPRPRVRSCLYPGDQFTLERPNTIQLVRCDPGNLDRPFYFGKTVFCNGDERRGQRYILGAVPQSAGWPRETTCWQ
jgi:hypothetical protein